VLHYLKKDLLPLKTQRLILRIPDPEEGAAMAAYYRENREYLRPWEPERPDSFFTAEFWEKDLRRMNNEFFLGQSARLVIFLKEAPREAVLGVCNFTYFMRGVFHACFLGYSIAEKYQGKGIMYEALKAAILFVTDTFGLHRIMANYMPRNERSGKLLRKLGFSVEGYARDYLRIAGKWEDHILTALISPKT